LVHAHLTVQFIVIDTWVGIRIVQSQISQTRHEPMKLFALWSRTIAVIHRKTVGGKICERPSYCQRQRANPEVGGVDAESGELDPEVGELPAEVELEAFRAAEPERFRFQ
jgi:hypothetical protein